MVRFEGAAPSGGLLPKDGTMAIKDIFTLVDVYDEDLPAARVACLWLSLK